MLQSFSVSNFRSFLKRQEINFHASIDRTNEESLLIHGGHSFLRAIGIFGANASGKSNLFKALMAMKAVVCATTSLGDPVPGIVPFRLRQPARHATEFRIRVEVDNTEYDFSFAACSRRIHSETLYMKVPGGKRVLKYARRFPNDSKKETWQIKGLPERDADFLKKRTRENALFLSRAADENYPELGALVLWFKRQLWLHDLSRTTDALRSETAKQITSNEELRRGVLTLLQDADLGISNIAVRKAVGPSMPPDVPAEVQSQVRAKLSHLNIPAFGISTFHVDNSGKAVEFDLIADESTGTQRFFGLIGMVLLALTHGSTVVVDEIDCSIHPLLVRKIVEMFNDPKANPKGAQLLFVTHDVSLFESRMLRRDQLWFAEKSSGGETSLFSLYDFGTGDNKPRKDEAFLKNYLQGRYGAVATFGPSLEDMTIPCAPEMEIEADHGEQ